MKFVVKTTIKHQAICLFTTVLLLAFSAGQGVKAQTIKECLQPAVKNGGFKMEGYILRCPTVIKVGQTYYIFASRWEEKYQPASWATHSVNEQSWIETQPVKNYVPKHFNEKK